MARAPLLPMPYKELNALQIRVTMSEIEPAVWRRLIVPWTWHLGQLHLAIQAAFNWWNCHLHEFNIGGLRYGDPELLEEGSFRDSPRVFDEREVRLLDFDHTSVATFSYLYDFGDCWRHTIEIEQRLALDVIPKVGACIAGARARPPEDVGGVDGYERFLATMADRNDPEHAEVKQWCGGHFDPDWFDLTLADKDVKNALRANVRRRLHQPKPEQRGSSGRRSG
jgi:hypothetical protein